jgi:hypothetical protein
MMLRAYRTAIFSAAAVAAAVMLMGVPSPSHAQTGTIRVNVTKAGFIVGVGGGSGTLTFKGRNYPLSIGGLSVGTFGATSADLVGNAYNLRTPADVTGTYTAVGAGVAIVAGGKAVRLQNANGVILELRGRQVGLEVSLNLSGMTVSLR